MASDIDRRQFTETFLAGAARDPVVALGNCPAKNYWPANATPCGYPSTTSCGPGSILSATASKRGSTLSPPVHRAPQRGGFCQTRDRENSCNRYEASVPTRGGRRGAPETGLRGGRSLSAAGSPVSHDQTGASGPDDHGSTRCMTTTTKSWESWPGIC